MSRTPADGGIKMREVLRAKEEALDAAEEACNLLAQYRAQLEAAIGGSKQLLAQRDLLAAQVATLTAACEMTVKRGCYDTCSNALDSQYPCDCPAGAARAALERVRQGNG